jgi:hypothetical protein
MLYRWLILGVFAISNLACSGKDNKVVNQGSLSADSTAQKMKAATVKDGEITERGIVKEIEDSGYPFATVTIEFPERKFSEYFTINMEEVENASLDVIRNYVGKYVVFNYTSTLSYALLDLQKDGKSLLGMNANDIDPSWKIIEGELDGASEESLGDLPGEVSIWADDGENQYFQFYVTAEMVAANGKRVKGFYDVRTKNDIKSIKLMDEK